MLRCVCMLRPWFVRVLPVAALAVAIPGGLAADDAAKKAPNPEKVFGKRDANGDKFLTLEEFKTGLKDKALANADKRFRRLDTSGDGKVSLEEFKAGVAAKK